MALHTVCGTNERNAAKPLAIIEALGPNEALRKIEAMRRLGEFAWLPSRVLLTARRATRSEAKTFLEFMRWRDDSSSPARDGSATELQKRRALIFHHKLWLGEIGGTQ
jgi:hypothetical protein